MKWFALAFYFAKQRGLGKVNRERVVLSILITINAELAFLNGNSSWIIPSKEFPL